MDFEFTWDSDSHLILVSIIIDNTNDFTMILDTGASNTTIDRRALFLLGYDFNDKVDEAEIETANGIVIMDVFQIKNFTALGIKKEPYLIQTYDHKAHGIISDYNGVLGLDFFEGRKFCIDLRSNAISVD